MLAYLRGTVHSKEMTGAAADRLVLEVSGVGFELAVSRRTLLTVGQVGEAVTVHTALAIRENEWTIFGFATPKEREMFGLLQSVSGVGPKLALGLIGALGPDELARAILSADQKMISQAPGVGAKVAQRLILELKSKIQDWSERQGVAGSTTAPSPSATFEEVRSILGGLGYTPTEINLALKQAEDEQLGEDVELIIRQSLKVLGAVGR